MLANPSLNLWLASSLAGRAGRWSAASEHNHAQLRRETLGSMGGVELAGKTQKSSDPSAPALDTTHQSPPCSVDLFITPKRMSRHGAESLRGGFLTCKALWRDTPHPQPKEPPNLTGKMISMASCHACVKPQRQREGPTRQSITEKKS